MESNFCGSWVCGNEKLVVQKNGKTFSCSLPRKNIGIVFDKALVVSEFDNETPSAGVGVYSPIGDGYSISALWSSKETAGRVGSGFALKHDGVPEFIGEYSVKYFEETRESGAFIVKIDATANKNIYKLSWFLEDKNVLHGIGMIVNKSLAFSWGHTDCKLGFSMFSLCEKNNSKWLVRHIVKWDSPKIECCDYINVQT